jgi:tetratricopeptide (TPR) repeat protein
VSNDLYLADCLVAVGFCYDTKLSDYEKALSSYKGALSRYKYFGSNHVSVSNALQNLGSIYYTMQKWEDALRCYKNRLSILNHFLKIDSDTQHDIPKDILTREAAHTMICIAKVSIELGVDSDAIEFYENAKARFKFMMENTSEHTIETQCCKEVIGCLSEVCRMYIKQSTELEAVWRNRHFCELNIANSDFELLLLFRDFLKEIIFISSKLVA